MQFDQELDATGLNCPLPILRARKALGPLESGKILHIVATDPGALKDFEAFAKQTGHDLVDTREDEGRFHFFIRKS